MARGKRFFLLGLLCAAAMTGLFVYTQVGRDAGERLTQERLDEARARWEGHGPLDYVVDIEVRGAQRGRHHVEVRGGAVVAMTTGGVPVQVRGLDDRKSDDPRTYWSVDGMFRVLADELRNLDRAKEAYGVDGPDDVVLRASFDPAYGYPVRFLRHVLGKSQSVEWEVRLTPTR